ncbi:MAG: MFS transporter [Candidatus Lokiarchaeota archaeon]|nr:MFS transporter [Candidatus Lokiarchaeota archaeon]MBD3199855.1 MFS transporter [Candidatus Lokiarchaeota archaeon]
MQKEFKSPIKKIGKHARVLLISVLLAVSFRSIGFSVVDIGLPNFILELSGSLISYGLVKGIFSVMQSIFQFPVAAASDKYGRKYIIIIAMGVYTLGTFLSFTAQNITQLFLYRAIQGAGAYTSILQAIISDIYEEEQHGKGMGYYSLSMNVGYFGGIVLGGYISSYLGFRNIFSISGFLILISAIFLILVFRHTDTENIVGAEKSKSMPNMALNKENVLKLLREPQFGIAIFINSLRWFIFGGIVAYLVWVLQVFYNIDEISCSYYLLLIVAVYVCFVIISGKVIDKQGPRKMMLIGQSIAILAGIPFFFDVAHIFIVFTFINIFIGIGLALYDPAGATLILNVIMRINPNLGGTGIGLNNAVGFFFSAIGPIVFSILGEQSIFYPFYLTFFLILIAFIMTKFLISSERGGELSVE